MTNIVVAGDEGVLGIIGIIKTLYALYGSAVPAPGIFAASADISGVDILVVNGPSREALPDADVLVVNSDERDILPALRGRPARLLITYGFNKKACVTASSISEQGCSICVQRAFTTVSNQNCIQQEFTLSVKARPQFLLAAAAASLVGDLTF